MTTRPPTVPDSQTTTSNTVLSKPLIRRLVGGRVTLEKDSRNNTHKVVIDTQIILGQSDTPS